VKHLTLTDDDRERATLWALDRLDADEARAFAAHLAEGCAACRDEVDGLTAVTRDLALAAPPVTPPSSVRARVVRAASFRFVLDLEGEWIDIAAGVQQKTLAAGGGGVSQTYLIRMAPGARVPRHEHAAVEHCYVVDGDLHIAGRHVGRGDYHRAAAGTAHEAPWSERGCVLLIVESPA
jgi:anti-sigma factor ChrR (cupin superfamily)